MNRKVIRTDQAPAPVGPYNQAIAASGQLVLLPVKSSTPAPAKLWVSSMLQKQTEQVIANIKAVVEAAGSKLQNVVKTTVFLADMNDFECGLCSIF